MYVIYSVPCLFYPHWIKGRPAALSVLAIYVNICRSQEGYTPWSEYECNVYVHDGDVTVRVHSLNRIKRMELHTFFSYNILPRLNCVSFRRDCYSLLKELVILRGGIKIYIFAQDLPGE